MRRRERQTQCNNAVKDGRATAVLLSERKRADILTEPAAASGAIVLRPMPGVNWVTRCVGRPG